MTDSTPPTASDEAADAQAAASLTEQPPGAEASDAEASDAEASDALAGEVQADASQGADATDLSKEEIAANIVDNIREVFDPEIPVNVYDLGLIYEITVHDDRTAHVLMTLTAPNCPAAGILPGQVEQAARLAEGVKDAEVELTFDPPFTPDMMSDEARLELGFM